MKLFTLLTLFTAIFTLSFVYTPSGNEPGGIDFQDITFQQALDRAKKEKKLIFLDAYAEWCGPCKWMNANVFTDQEVGSLFNENFINLKMDMEKGEGPEIARKYQVRAYPTMFLIDSEGKIVKRILGAKQKKDLISEIKPFLN
ncbi:MAG: thioredoxin domain-containing protein [Brumimicrobium sp.]|nr:thioredoxin domain-containing protein [Brumimicrobium sp.]